MKKYIIISLLLLSSVFSYSQKTQKIQDAIWGCKYGSSKEVVAQAIKLQGYIPKFDGYKIRVDNIEYADISFDYVTFYFYLDQLYMCDFDYNSNNESSITASYTRLKKNLSFKYGSKKEDIEENTKIIHYFDYLNSVSILFSNYEFNSKISYILTLRYCNDILLKKAVNEM